MPPALLARVMHRATRPLTHRTAETGARLEIQTQIEAPLPSVEARLHHPPRLLQAKRPRKQLQIAHPRLPSSTRKPGTLDTSPDVTHTIQRGARERPHPGRVHARRARGDHTL